VTWLGTAAAGYRALRVLGRQVLGSEPRIRVSVRVPLEFHGNAAGGWMIQRDSLDAGSVVVDVGIGEDASFPESIIRKYGCLVHGFDPTPRAIEYVRRLNNERLKLVESGLGPQAGPARFFLPINRAHVSGSVTKEAHLGTTAIDVEMVTLAQVFELLRCDRIDLLKLDIEGTEYDVIASEDFQAHAPAIGQLCVEFHHRWEGRGKGSTERAADRLRDLGFACAWSSRSTNEEFLFVNTRWMKSPAAPRNDRSRHTSGG
jgi:FkbM family methyltransferase